MTDMRPTWPAEFTPAKSMTDTLPRTDVPQLIKDSAEAHLWGTLQFDFHDGEIVLIRRTETLKTRKENHRRDRVNAR